MIITTLLVYASTNDSTHVGQVMPYGDIDLGQHWLTITWTNADQVLWRHMPTPGHNELNG